MNDVFVEQIIEKKQTAKTALLKMLIIFTAVAISSLFLFIGALRFIFPAVFALSMYGAIRLVKNQNLEYEYSFTNGELDVDKIIGRRSRKRELSVHVRSFEILAPLTEEYQNEHEKRNFTTTLDASTATNSDNRWFATFRDYANNDTLLIFEPNERLLDAMKKFIPSSKIKQ